MSDLVGWDFLLEVERVVTLRANRTFDSRARCHTNTTQRFMMRTWTGRKRQRCPSRKALTVSINVVDGPLSLVSGGREVAVIPSIETLPKVANRH